MDFATCDLCDANEEKLIDGSLTVLPPVFSTFGKRSRFSGPVRTLKVFEDNVLVRAALETPGEGSVLVVRGLDCIDGTPLVDLKPDSCAYSPVAPAKAGGG